MKGKSFGRGLMVAAGILAVVVILLSNAFQRETTQILTEANAKTDTREDGGKKFAAIPSDAVTSSQACEVETVNPFVIQEIIGEDKQPMVLPLPSIKLPVSIFKAMLRSVISPQAP
jgi:hypothetical protein